MVRAQQYTSQSVAEGERTCLLGRMKGVFKYLKYGALSLWQPRCTLARVE
jgi:hypothetical protein